MRKYPLPLLHPGMVVARPVFSADGLVLLNKGKELRPSYIQRLHEQGIPAIYVEDHLMSGVDVEDVISEQTRLKAIKTVKSMFAGLSFQVKADRKPEINELLVKQTVTEVVDDLLNRGDVMVNLTDIRAVDDYTYGHCVNVCVLALMTGISLGYERHNLLYLGMGALLHDVGKVKVPPEVLNKPGPLDPHEFEEVKKHPGYGFEMLKGLAGFSGLSAQIAYQHHEKFDGSGYPRGLQGREIHEFAQIVGMVDVYDALTADRIYRKAYQPYEAFEMIAGTGNYLFDYRLVQAFLNNVALYPVGIALKLNSGHIGLVVDTPKGMPHRPTVRLLCDPEGQIIAEPYEEKLSENSKLLIDRTLTEEEYTAIRNRHRKTS
ncbi:hypothetical protein SY88_07305 [Clostridiales bacterium PH28_bin88]|nr:hypothetical protein SY88_07305 [Clostridiales bacterium PH28_bin88]